MDEKQKIVVIVGPTASGKSDLAVELARKFGGEVVSADSRQVYRGLDIGSGKITKREMRGVPHHLLDTASPRRTFTAHDFVVRGRKEIHQISARGKVPIIAGGTGFYIDTLLGRVALPNIPANLKLRKELEKKTPSQLLALLRRKNPSRARAIKKHNEQNNKRRLIRALEVELSTPYPQKHYKGAPFINEVLWVGIAPPKEKLRQKISDRLIARLKKGMVAEAKRLHEKGLSYRRMNELGLEYRYLALFLQSKLTREEMIERLSAKIWQYARRQMSYWRRNKDIRWFRPTKTGEREITTEVKKFLEN